MNEITVKYMLADKTKMKNAIMGFSKEFQTYKIIGYETIPDKTNSSLLNTKIISEDKKQAEFFLASKSFRTHLRNHLKNRFEIIFEKNHILI